MMSPKIWLLVLLSGFVVATPVKEEPETFENKEATDRIPALLTCYEGPNGLGSSVRLITHAADLGQYNFYKRAVSCCFTGVWVLYDAVNFNFNNLQGLSFYGYGHPSSCINFDASFSRRAASARLVSNPNGIEYDSLSLFGGNFFNGYHAFVQTTAISALQYAPFGLSAVVTGAAPWTLYSGPNGSGNCACLFPKPGYAPGFYTNGQQLGIMSGRVVSVRKGCYCSVTIYPPQ